MKDESTIDLIDRITKHTTYVGIFGIFFVSFSTVMSQQGHFCSKTRFFDAFHGLVYFYTQTDELMDTLCSL